MTEMTGESILVVDNSERMRKSVAALLSAEYPSIGVDCASDGLEGLAMTKVRDYAVIISDIEMPRMDGTALFKALVRNNPHVGKRFIFMSGGLEPGYEPSAGEFMFLPKPFDAEDLYLVVNAALEKWRGNIPT